MKRLICLLGHSKHLMKIKHCNTENFENENRSIRVYTCKYCNKDILVVTKYIKPKVIK